MNISDFCKLNNIDEKELEKLVNNCHTVLEFNKSLADQGIIINYEASAEIYYQELK